MKIRTQFMITMCLFGALLIVVAASVIITSRQAERADRQENIAEGIAQGASELSYLANDYLIYRESQQLRRWQSRFASFTARAAGLSVDNLEQQVLVRNIQTNQKRLKEVFDSVASGLGSQIRNPGGTLNAEFLQVAWSRLAVQSQALVSDASRLSQMLRAQAEELKQINLTIIFAMIGLFGFYFLVNSMMIQRRILKSLRTLQSGTAAVGSGNLEFSLEEGKDDEIGDLSRAFNRMTINLKSLTASKADLEMEVEGRLRIEEALRENELVVLEQMHRLQAVLDATPIIIWTAFDPECRKISGNRAAREFSRVPVGTDMSKTGSAPKELAHYRVFKDGAELAPGEMPIQRVAATGKPFNNYALEFLFADQSVRSLLGNVVPVFDADGKPSGAVAAFMDITERKLAEEALRRSETRFKLLSETSNRLLSTDKPQAIVNELCREVMAYLDCQTFFNFLVDGPADRLHLNAYAGIPAENARQIEWLDFGVAVCGCVARDRTRIITEDVLHTPDRRTVLIKSYGIQAYCCHPLMAQGRLIGTLSFGTKTRPHFTPEEVDLMRTVTDQVAMAMQRIQTQEALQRHALELQQMTENLEKRVQERTAELANLSAELVTAQEKERERISYDLHDHVWQTLLAIRLEIEMLFARPDKADWETLGEKSKEVMAHILGVVGKIRSMQGDLWPYVLDDIGIVSTIAWYCREFEKRHIGVVVHNRVGLTEAEIPTVPKIVIYRIMQEALSNSAQHSRATHIALSLDKTDHRLVFTVKDNGIGFDPGETMAKRSLWGGLGLLSIKARTELSGGFFEVQSAKGKGTTIQASWPI